jgi:hypothetical protein
MALPQRQPERPEMLAAAHNPRVAPAPRPADGGTPAPPKPDPGGVPTLPPPKPVDTKKDPADPGPGKVVPDPKVEVPDPKADPGAKDGVRPPLPGEDPLGELRSKDVLVLTRGGNGRGWVRIDPEKPVVPGSLPVLALPGFRADVKLDSDVLVHLWGNVPEQVAMPQMVMQSRVVFHPAAAGFDADLTLEQGRVYLKTLKPGGAKVRVRLGGEVWDVSLRNNATDVLVQLHTAFIPGAKAGESARSEATLAVIAGAAKVEAPARFKTFDPVEAGKQITWDSVKGQLSDKQPVAADLFPERVPALEAEYGKTLQKVLSDAARSLASPEGIRVMLKERLTKPFPDTLKGPPTPLVAIAIAFPTQLAAYSYAAIMDGPDAPDLLKDLIDTLGDGTRPYARQAAVMALSSWVAQSPGNTDFLVKGMVEKGWRDDDSALIARLLRGYSSFAAADPQALDQLVGYLDHPQLAVREVALGNLFAFFDREAQQVPDLRIDVARRSEVGSERAYEKFLAAWKARAEEIKKKLAEKK